MKRFLQKFLHRLAERSDFLWQRVFLHPMLRLRGMGIGAGTTMPRPWVTWPHQVEIGERCLLEHGIHFKFDGIWQPGPLIRIGREVFVGAGCEFNIRKGIIIGDGALIASGCRFIDHDHGIAPGVPIRAQPGPEAGIVLGNNVWLGAGVIVLKGVTIGVGAVIAAGAVVTKPVPPGEIWSGIPARKAGER